MREIIAKVGKHITDCMDVQLGMTKMDESRPEYWMLNSILTDEMAELILKMKVRKPYTVQELAKRIKWNTTGTIRTGTSSMCCRCSLWAARKTWYITPN